MPQLELLVVDCCIVHVGLIYWFLTHRNNSKRRCEPLAKKLTTSRDIGSQIGKETAMFSVDRPRVDSVCGRHWAMAPRWLLVAGVVLGLALNSAETPAAVKYQNVDEAWRVGVAYYNSRNYAASQEPFEAALKMAPDDKFRLKVYEALIPAYRLLPDINKMLEACEFVIDKSDSIAKRSLTRRSLLSFVYQRGKVDVLVKRYEQVLAKDADNRKALYLLSEIYSRLQEDPQRAAQLTERLARLEQKNGQPVDILKTAELARRYVAAKRYKEGAALYEKIAPLDEKLAAWHWKEAAAAWLKVGDKDRALAAAKKSAESTPEQRNDLLAHFWHRGLADAFLALGEAALAIPHYEQAIKKTNIEGYVKDCEKSLAEARAKARK
jgi:tetratricopeptide (TPR) repeat protein